jgi:hypothetical protein
MVRGLRRGDDGVLEQDDCGDGGEEALATTA